MKTFIDGGASACGSNQAPEKSTSAKTSDGDKVVEYAQLFASTVTSRIAPSGKTMASGKVV
jgi:hypothetical protein